jgi:hypothetical protein
MTYSERIQLPGKSPYRTCGIADRHFSGNRVYQELSQAFGVSKVQFRRRFINCCCDYLAGLGRTISSILWSRQNFSKRSY